MSSPINPSSSSPMSTFSAPSTPLTERPQYSTWPNEPLAPSQQQGTATPWLASPAAPNSGTLGASQKYNTQLGPRLYHAVRDLPVNMPLVQTLLQQGADPNYKDEAGMSVLYIAAERGNVPLVKLLLNAGVNIAQSACRDGYAPLHVAVLNGHADVVSELAHYWPNPSAHMFEDITPLGVCVTSSQPIEKKQQIISILAWAGANMERVKTIDHSVHMPAFYLAILQNDYKLAATLLNYGASINGATSDGYTSLHVAAQQNNIKAARFLLIPEERGVYGASTESNAPVADPGARTAEGYTPRQLALQTQTGENHKAMLELLDNPEGARQIAQQALHHASQAAMPYSQPNPTGQRAMSYPQPAASPMVQSSAPVVYAAAPSTVQPSAPVVYAAAPSTVQPSGPVVYAAPPQGPVYQTPSQPLANPRLNQGAYPMVGSRYSYGTAAGFGMGPIGLGASSMGMGAMGLGMNPLSCGIGPVGLGVNSMNPMGMALEMDAMQQQSVANMDNVMADVDRLTGNYAGAAFADEAAACAERQAAVEMAASGNFVGAMLEEQAANRDEMQAVFDVNASPFNTFF